MQKGLLVMGLLVMLGLALAPTVEALIFIFTPPNESEGPKGLKWKNHPKEYAICWWDMAGTRVNIYPDDPDGWVPSRIVWLSATSKTSFKTTGTLTVVRKSKEENK